MQEPAEPWLPAGLYHLPIYNGVGSIPSLAPSLGTARVRGMGAAMEHPSVAPPQPARDAAAEAARVESRAFVSQGISEGAGRVYEM